MIILYIIKKIGALFFTIISALSLFFCKKHDKRDPYKRLLNNTNYRMLRELDKSYTYYDDKPLNLVLDLDGTLAYCQHKPILGKTA